MATYDAEVGPWVISTHSDTKYVWLTERGTGKKIRLKCETAYLLGRALVKVATVFTNEGATSSELQEKDTVPDPERPSEHVTRETFGTVTVPDCGPLTIKMTRVTEPRVSERARLEAKPDADGH